MARTLMAYSPGLARTIVMVSIGHFMHNSPWKAGTTLGLNYFSWSQACLSHWSSTVFGFQKETILLIWHFKEWQACPC